MNVSDHSSISQLPTVSVLHQPQPPSSLSQNPRFKNEVEIAEKLQLPASSSAKIQKLQAEMLHTPQSELEQQFDELSGDLRETPAIARCGGLGLIKSIEINSDGLLLLHESCGAMQKPIDDNDDVLLGSLEKLQAMATILVQRRPPSNETTAPQPQPSQSVLQPSFSATASQLGLRSNTIVTTSTSSDQSSSIGNAQSTSSLQLQPSGTSGTSPVAGSSTALGTGTLLSAVSLPSIPDLSRRIKSAIQKLEKSQSQSDVFAASQIKLQELLVLGQKLKADATNPKHGLTNCIRAILGAAKVNTRSPAPINNVPPEYAINAYTLQTPDGVNETIWVTTRNTSALPRLLDICVLGNRNESALRTLKREMLNVVKQSSSRLLANANKLRSDNTRGA
jgi:hypothetical protein